MLALGLKPGQSDVTVFDVTSLNAVALYVACSAIGIRYSVSLTFNISQLQPAVRP